MCFLSNSFRKVIFLGHRNVHFLVGNSLAFPGQFYPQFLMVMHFFHNNPHVFEDDYLAPPSLLQARSILLLLISSYRPHFPAFESSLWVPLPSETSPSFSSPSPFTDATGSPKAEHSGKEKLSLYLAPSAFNVVLLLLFKVTWMMVVQ